MSDVKLLTDPIAIGSMLNEFDSQLIYIQHESAKFIYCNGCLFPSVEIGPALSIHAAIPEKYRGIQAINAGKNVIKWANSRYRFVFCRIAINEKHVNLYAKWCGLRLYKADYRYNYYEAPPSDILQKFC